MQAEAEPQLGVLEDACLLVGALGLKEREELITWFCSEQACCTSSRLAHAVGCVLHFALFSLQATGCLLFFGSNCPPHGAAQHAKLLVARCTSCAARCNSCAARCLLPGGCEVQRTYASASAAQRVRRVLRAGQADRKAREDREAVRV